MHHEEDQRIRVSRSDEPASDCDVAANEMDQGEASAKQRLFLVFDDPGLEHDVLIVCTVLNRYPGYALGSPFLMVRF